VSGVDLVQWLGEQLDEEQRIAEEAARHTEPDWSDGGTYGESVTTEPRHVPVAVGPWSGQMLDEVRAHIAAHDPARVLREIEAKRDLLRLASAAHDYHETFTSGFASALEGTLRLFALAYADRVGYREEWRP
jgi:hypothetical protein